MTYHKVFLEDVSLSPVFRVHPRLLRVVFGSSQQEYDPGCQGTRPLVRAPRLPDGVSPGEMADGRRHHDKKVNRTVSSARVSAVVQVGVVVRIDDDPL